MSEPKRQPTIKQMKAISLVVENGGNVTQAMRDAGYAESTVNNPSNLTKTATWQELMEAYLPDDMLLRALSDDIEKKEGNRVAELTLATKMKGKLVERSDVTTGGEKITSITDAEKTALLSLLNDKGSSN